MAMFATVRDGVHSLQVHIGGVTWIHPHSDRQRQSAGPARNSLIRLGAEGVEQVSGIGGEPETHARSLATPGIWQSNSRNAK